MHNTSSLELNTTLCPFLIYLCACIFRKMFVWYWVYRCWLFSSHKQAPRKHHPSWEGLCRQSIRPCAKTNIVGTFLSGTNIYVKLQQYKVSIDLCNRAFCDFLICEKISFSPLKLNVITLAIVIYIILCTCRYRSWVKGQLSTQKRQRHKTGHLIWYMLSSPPLLDEGSGP